jgi:hypothetical protein
MKTYYKADICLIFRIYESITNSCYCSEIQIILSASSEKLKTTRVQQGKCL